MEARAVTRGDQDLSRQNVDETRRGIRGSDYEKIFQLPRKLPGISWCSFRDEGWWLQMRG